MTHKKTSVNSSRSVRRQPLFGILAAALLITSCSLEEVPNNGDRCPPIDANPAATLAYINSRQFCAIGNTMCEFKDNFDKKACPIQFKHCMKDDELNYHCAESNTCAENAFLCDHKCVSPKDSDTCGIQSDCSGGSKCNDDEICKKNGELNYRCVEVTKCAENTFLCDEKCVSPKDSETCGIQSDCSGGSTCTDDEICKLQGDNYECTQVNAQACPENMVDIQAGEDSPVCVDPYSDTNCGALDSEHPGESCASDRHCQGGTCVCRDEYFECDGKCVLQSDPKYCGIKENCTESSRSFENCEEKSVDGLVYHCTNEEIEYKCSLKSCPEHQTLCSGKCIDKSDKNNCGECGNPCSEQHANVKEAKCIENSGNFVCEYQCEEGFINCAKPGEPPNCTSLQTSDSNCGKCGNVCAEGRSCLKGMCVKSECTGDKRGLCFKEGTGCIDSEDTCGIKCAACQTDEICTKGICHVKSCGESMHILYDNDSYTYQCKANGPDQCANPDNLSNHDIQNCNQIYPNATTACESGKCVLKSCDNGFHLDNGKCVRDDENNCGKKGLVCKTEKPNSATVSCVNGSCVVNTCASNYHVYNNTCEQNSVQHCGKHDNTCDDTKILKGEKFECSSTGRCLVSVCNYAYHPSADKTQCEIDSRYNCGAVGVVCSDHCIIYRDQSRCGKCGLENNVILKGTTGDDNRCYVKYDKCDEVAANYKTLSNPKPYQRADNRACKTNTGAKGRAMCVYKNKTWSCEESVYTRY